MGEWDVVSQTPDPGGWEVVKQEQPGAFSRFFSSLAAQLNPVPAIQEWLNRPTENAKASDALHVLHDIHKRAAAMPENKGKPLEQWKSPELTSAENLIVEKGLHANLGSTEGQHPMLAPMQGATSQAMQGDYAGAAGTLAGGYGVPAATGAAFGSIPEGTGAALKSALKAGGKDVAVGGAKTAAGAALAHSGPLGEIGDVVAGMPIIKSGVQQFGKGVMAGYEALKKSIADSRTPASTVTDRTPIWQQPGIQPAEIPDQPVNPTVAPQPRPITAPQDIQPPAREPIWKGLPSTTQEKFGPQETPARPQLPSGRKPGGAAIDTASGEIVNKQTAGDVGTTQFEGAYPISAEERTGGPMVAPKEAYQRAARTTKARALSRYLRIGGISLEDAQSMTAEQWGLAADGAGVNVPSPDSVKLALSELEKLYTAKGAVKIDDALRKGNLAEAHFYTNKITKTDPAQEGTLQ